MTRAGMSANAGEIAAGVLLLFFLPGYTWTKAVFPEWRIRGAVATLRLLEVVTLSFVSSIAWTVLVGYGLLTLSPAGFQAYWTDPALEVGLAIVAGVGFGLGYFRGAYAREPPSPPSAEPMDESTTWDLMQELEELRRRERRVRHELRRAPSGSPEALRLTGELEQLRADVDALASRREAEYVG